MPLKNLRTYILGGVTLGCALGIGYVMQFGLSLPGDNKGAQIEVGDINFASSGPAFGAPRPPLEGVRLQQTESQTAAQTDRPSGLSAIGAGTSRPERTAALDAPQCDIAMDAVTTAGAMVLLTLDAPCHPNERVTFHHEGMMFTEVTSPRGKAALKVPALAEQAEFAAAFANRDGAIATSIVESMRFYDRVVIQWSGNAGLQLHAREFGAAYFTEGHIWAQSSGDMTRTAGGEGGFLKRMGNTEIPQASLAEIYTFPTAAAKRGGKVELTVEAEVTAANCESQVQARTLQKLAGQDLQTRELTLEMPDCASMGDFLVLKNIVEDLKVAAK